MKNSTEFIHLHNHTEYSFLDGGIRIKDLCDKCLEICNMRGLCKEYYSANLVCVENYQNHLLYTTKYSNRLDFGGGFPPHILYLKENAPIILLCNLDPKYAMEQD